MRSFFFMSDNDQYFIIPESIYTPQMVLAYLQTRGVTVALIGGIGPSFQGSCSDTAVYYVGTEGELEVMAVVGKGSEWLCLKPEAKLEHFPMLETRLKTFRWLYEAKARQAFREIRSGRRVAPVITDPLFVPEKHQTIHVKDHDPIS